MALFNSQWASTLVELPTLTFHNALLPLSIFSALHGIKLSMAYRKAIEQAAEQSLKDGTAAKPPRTPWGQALLSVLVMSLGGGFTTSMLLGMPPSWLGSNVVVPTHGGRFGGGMWADLLKLKSHQWTFSTPSFVHTATYDMKAAFLSAFFYAASTSPQFYQLFRGDSDLDGSLGKVGLLELQDAKAMTMLVMCTLMLGQRAEQTVLRLTGLDGGSLAWGKSDAFKQSTRVSKKNDEFDVQELKAMSKIDRDDEKVYQPLRRRGRQAEEPTEDDEEQEEERGEEDEEEEPAKKSTRGRKKGSGKTLGSPAPSSTVSADVPLIRSTRLRKPARQEL
ncbi:unnamed protein product [Mortierella alpina]